MNSLIIILHNKLLFNFRKIIYTSYDLYEHHSISLHHILSIKRFFDEDLTLVPITEETG